MSAMYIEKHFDKQIKLNIKEMIRGTRFQALKIFKDATWMEEETKNNLLDGLKYLDFKYVGFMNELLDSVKMKKSYKEFILPRNFFLSSLYLKKWKKQSDIDVDSNIYSFEFREHMEEPPFLVNAFYSPNTNGLSNHFYYLKKNIFLILFTKFFQLLFYKLHITIQIDLNT